MKNGPFLSALDAMAYGEYCYFCGGAGTRPWTLPQWLLMTERSVIHGFNSWVKDSQRDPNKINLDADGRLVVKRGLSQHDRNVIADMKQQFGDHARFGELRKDGGVYPVRPQPAASTEGIKKSLLSPLTRRTCSRCRRFLDARFFYVKRGIIREVCKSCDNARRRAKKPAAAKVAERSRAQSA